ncbi:hypothetical protein DdX_08850 [Ditylenchus destructor]|uniref:Uncharacterized protein n=1 Tax=Ditylenchus destructor TaxID=166010 RepID=A0AAD4N7G5_9BILA|nr:hypothetical protein DdX_08850 [Ditylenchus destructor]
MGLFQSTMRSKVHSGKTSTNSKEPRPEKTKSAPAVFVTPPLQPPPLIETNVIPVCSIDVSTAKEYSPPSSINSVDPSMCNCRAALDSNDVLADDKALFKDGVRYKYQPTKTKPYNFGHYAPLNLVIISNEDAKRGLTSAAQKLPEDGEETILTAFSPILQCIVYAVKHATLIKHLADDYNFLEGCAPAVFVTPPLQPLPSMVTNGKPVCSIDVSTAKEYSPPSSQINSVVPSMCNCRAALDSNDVLADDKALFKDGVRYEYQPTKTKPYNFGHYAPLNLVIISNEDAKRGLTSAAQKLPEDGEETILTAFFPILQCIVYAVKHATLIKHLADDYNFLGSD